MADICPGHALSYDYVIYPSILLFNNLLKEKVAIGKKKYDYSFALSLIRTHYLRTLLQNFPLYAWYF